MDESVDKQDLLAMLVHPKNAQVGDYVLIWAGRSYPGTDIVQVTEVKGRSYVRVNGREQAYRREDLLPPTKYRKEQYLEGLRLAAYPVVTAYIPSVSLPKFPDQNEQSIHVVGRPALTIADVSIARSPSNYLDIRFSLLNEGADAVDLGSYDWGDEDDKDKDKVPFAYLDDVRHKVFQVEGGGRIYPGHVAHYRVAVSNRAGVGMLRLFVPSGLMGGGLGTYTMLLLVTPPFQVAQE